MAYLKVVVSDRYPIQNWLNLKEAGYSMSISLKKMLL